jgi:superfamily I DNA/RNA helicase
LEVSILADLMTPDEEPMSEAENGLFLVGDGAQTIYKRGFRLIQSGLSVANRSFAFKKNYRNTKEILTAAYGLIQTYEFADVDEDNIVKPMEPEFAARHGDKPQIWKCLDRQSEMRFVATCIHDLLEENSSYQICVIAADPRVRDDIARELDSLNVKNLTLKDDSSLSEDVVKISTIESAKGHEFTHVFVPALVEGILPRDVPQEEISREAARLYAAMTRARDNLYLSYALDTSRKPSRFLVAVQRFCVEKKWTGYFSQDLS